MTNAMQRIFKGFLLFFTLLALASPTFAAIDWDVATTLKTATAPLDVTASVDGKWTFVLGEGGKLYIFAENGALTETISVDPGMDRIASSGLQPANIQDKLYLASSKNKTVQVVTIDFSVNIDISGAPFLGPENAPVVIVEFSDFECPYCSKTVLLNEALLAKYPKQVKIVFKQFPLSFHKQAQPAALAALAAHHQGKFWQYHDLLFENQKALSDARYVEAAKQLGLDLQKFNSDRNSPGTRQQLENDINEGRKAGVRGTPSLFLNGRRVKDRNLESVEKMIEQELARIGK
ncbi:DsbA family protein [Thiovibrio sp. JS02]